MRLLCKEFSNALTAVIAGNQMSDDATPPAAPNVAANNSVAITLTKRLMILPQRDAAVAEASITTMTRSAAEF